MSTGDLIGTIYFGTAGVVAVVSVFAVVSYVILCDEYDNWADICDTEDRWMTGVGGSFMSLLVGLLWPLAVMGAIAAAPALTVRYRRESAAKKKREQVASLRAAAELFPRGSDERRLLLDAAMEAQS